MIEYVELYYSKTMGYCLLYRVKGYEYGTGVTEEELEKYTLKQLARRHYESLPEDEKK